jgi:hypothetical protein
MKMNIKVNATIGVLLIILFFCTFLTGFATYFNYSIVFYHKVLSVFLMILIIFHMIGFRDFLKNIPKILFKK